MKILILGGTLFLGRFLTEIALERGHEVTLFNRGKTNPELFPEVEKLTGDRRVDLRALQGHRWDTVIDTSGYIPREVKKAVDMLVDKVNHYTFISSISVYEMSNFERPGTDENGSLQKLADETTEEITGESYGGLKVLCENAAQASLPALIIRPGLIVGPYDPSYRFDYWLARAASGGEMLAPGNPSSPLQIIDVRDLALWIIRMVEKWQTGIYNATGPAYPLTFGECLETCRAPQTQLTWVKDDFLLEHGVQPFSELPFWMPADMAGVHQISITKALAEGLTFRPLVETVKDTLPFALQMQQAQRGDTTRRGGITAEREQALLQLWHQQKNA